ncbi:MAG TPA: hypothetical protein V6C57_16810 [Coleofasciculaceae cyanobacterium]
MPERSINDLIPAEKTQIALECIVLETAGNPKASEHLATKYSLSKRGVNQLKNTALKAIKDAFSPPPEAPTSGLLTIDTATLSRNLNSLLGAPTATKSGSRMTPAAEEDDFDESEEPIDVEEVYNAILEWNEGGNTPLIYISAGILEKISDSSKAEVKQWVSEHEKEIKTHNDRYKLTSKTNLSREVRGLDLRDKLGLLDN